MKLRIRGSSIRLRLTKPEVDALRSKGLVEDAAEFPGGARLRYALAVDGARLGASFDAEGLVLRVPRDRAEAWCGSDEVGIAGEDGPTRILIEKDWACVQPRSDEDPAEMYANPRVG
jgi:hypothetical protein